MNINKMQKNVNLTLFSLLLVFYEIATYLSNDAYIPALPAVAHEFITTHHMVQLTFAMWFLGGLSVQIFLGPLSDRYGRRPVILIGGVIFVISTLVCAFAFNINILLLGRYLQGAAVPSMIIAGYAAIHESLESNEAVQILAKMQSITVLAPAFGPLLGGILLTVVSWHWVFGLLAIWASFALIMLYFKMPETLPKEKRQTKIHIGNIASQYYRLLINMNFMKNILAGGMLVGTLIAWMLAGPFLIISEYHFNSVYFGVFQALIFGSFIFGSQLIKYLMIKNNLDKLIIKALWLVLLSAIASVVITYYSPHLLVGLIAMFMLVAFGVGLCFPILIRLAIEKSEEPMGARISMVSMVQFFSSVLAAGIVSIFYNRTLLSLAGTTVIFSLLAFIIKIFPDLKKGGSNIHWAL